MTPAEMAAINRANHPDGLGWTEDGIAALLADPGVVALTRSTGFALMRSVADEAELLTIDVRPEAQRRGTGTDLLREVLRVAARTGASAVFLEVAEDNAAARALYRAAGFVEVGRRPSYYRRPAGRHCDALVLRREMDAQGSGRVGQLT